MAIQEAASAHIVICHCERNLGSIESSGWWMLHLDTIPETQLSVQVHTTVGRNTPVYEFRYHSR